jgi:type II secretory pathway pseudopilin PulG
MNLSMLPKKTRTRKALHGWTILEMMIVMTLSAIMLASVGKVYIFMTRSLDATANYEELDRQSRNALDKMSSDIRGARCLTDFDSTHLWFTNLDNTLLCYVWDTNANTLSYTNLSPISPGPSSGILLKGCVFWKSSQFTHDPALNTTMTFLPLPVTNTLAQAAVTKVIVVDWICRKTNYMALTDSESVQTAKIVLRN